MSPVNPFFDPHYTSECLKKAERELRDVRAELAYLKAQMQRIADLSPEWHTIGEANEIAAECLRNDKAPGTGGLT